MKLRINSGNQFFYAKNRELIHFKGGDIITPEMLENFAIPIELIDFAEPESPSDTAEKPAKNEEIK